MTSTPSKTSERIIPKNFLHSKEAYLVYVRHLFPYEMLPRFLPESSHVLEVGSGEGYGTHLLSQKGYKVIGLDIDQQIIEHASQKYHSADCQFQWYDGRHFPVDDNSVDAVVSFQVIEHSKDDTLFLAEISRVLKLSGLCILTTPNRTYRVRPHRKPWNRFHVREYAPKALEQRLKHFFPDVSVWGIRGSDDIQEIEKARIKQIQKFVDIDPFHLRRLLPAAYETRLVNYLKRIFRKEQQPGEHGDEYLQKYSIRDYYLIQEKLEESLDIFAICKKKA